MIVELVLHSERKMARALIEENDLAFEDGVDAMFGCYEGERLVATGSRSGNILKMLAVTPEYQGGSMLGELVTALVGNGMQAGHESLFVYTKPEYITSFQALNFALLVAHEKVALLEYGKGLTKWLKSQQDLLRGGINGAVVVNCNPFTNGHRYLIENSTHRVDNLYVFVVSEDRSSFPFDVRYRLVKEGLADLDKVIVLDTSYYIVSSATFPTYFLKKDDPVARIQMELDAQLFATKIAPFFGITHRFVGTEPTCALTSGYNLAMQQIFPSHGIQLNVIERKRTAEGVISASKVRELLRHGDLTRITRYVPASTLAFLRSDAATPILQRLQTSR